MREIRVKPGRSKLFKMSEIDEQRKNPLSERVLQGIAFISESLGDCDNWLTVKKRLMLELPVDQRQLFSTRDPYSKKHQPFNQFEKKVRIEWLRLTGKLLLMPEDKKMDEVDPMLYL